MHKKKTYGKEILTSDLNDRDQKSRHIQISWLLVFQYLFR